MGPLFCLAIRTLFETHYANLLRLYLDKSSKSLAAPREEPVKVYERLPQASKADGTEDVGVRIGNGASAAIAAMNTHAKDDYAMETTTCA
jgi:hypothetical protein